MPKITSKMIGDAGEHYLVSQLMFHGIPAYKMPDNWPNYDIRAVRKNGDDVSISVKTRTWQKRLSSPWFEFNVDDEFDYIACIIAMLDQPHRIWIIPKGALDKYARKNKEGSKHSKVRWVTFNDLNNKMDLSKYENNYVLIK